MGLGCSAFAKLPDGDSSCNSETAQRAVILSFTVSRSLMLVSVTVDSQPKTLIFDTGAEKTMIQDSRNVLQNVRLTVGGKTFSNFPVAMVSLTGMQMERVGADGVLGQDVMSRFLSVNIDYKARKIELCSR